MITFSDDEDQLPDKNGEKTGATLTKSDFPRDFTLCAAYMNELWPLAWSSVVVVALQIDDGSTHWANIKLFQNGRNTQFDIKLGHVSFIVWGDYMVFPLTWTRFCVSLDTVSGNVVFVANGEVLKERVYYEALMLDFIRPKRTIIRMGYDAGAEYTGMVSQVNMFSSPLPTGKMVNLTSAGGEECGAAGDYVSWEEEDWVLLSKARSFMVGDLEKPCRRESEVNVYTANFEVHSAATNVKKKDGCMEHCQKIGKGRSPPVRTPEEWDWLREEVKAISNDISVFGIIWLAGTDEEIEGEWRDFYPPYDRLNTSVGFPWGYGDDKQFGVNNNCLQWYTEWVAHACIMEYQCVQSSMTCSLGCVIII